MSFEIIISIFSIVIAIYACYQADRVEKNNIEYNRKKATLEAYNILQNEVLDIMNLYTVEEIEHIILDKGSVEYAEISSYLARIEQFCVGINKEVYDDKLFYSIAKGYFDKSIADLIIPIISEKNCKNNFDTLFYQHTLSIIEELKELDCCNR